MSDDIKFSFEQRGESTESPQLIRGSQSTLTGGCSIVSSTVPRVPSVWKQKFPRLAPLEKEQNNIYQYKNKADMLINFSTSTNLRTKSYPQGVDHHSCDKYTLLEGDQTGSLS